MVDLDSYWKNGYLLARAVFEPADIARYEQRFIDIVEGRAVVDEQTIIMRDIMVVQGDVTPKSPLHAINKLMSFEKDPVLFEYALHAPMLEIVRALIGPEVVTISTNIFNKPPDVDGRHPLHQDLRYFKLRPADGIVATWTAMSATTRDNGCLVVLPGSHRGPLLEHEDPDWERVNFGFYAAKDVDLDGRAHVEMEPGDTLFFHPLLIHGSGRNRTQGFRRAISTHYASRQCERPDAPRRRDAVMKPIPGP